MHSSKTTLMVLFGTLTFVAGCDDGGGDPAGGGDGTGTPAPMSDGPGTKAVLVFSDMETGEADGGYFVTDGYPWEGAWFTYTDMTAGTIAPPEGDAFLMSPCDREGSAYCAHTSGGGFTTWGAGAGFNLKIPPVDSTSTTPGTVDAAALGAVGISFYAKSGAAATLGIRAKVLDAQVVPPAEGGSCEAGEGKCQDSFGVTLSLTQEWQYYELTFASLRQEGWGAPFDGVDASKIIGVQFQANMKTAPQFDFWVDDVAFMLE